MYSYTVRELAERVPVPGNPHAFEMRNGGCVVTIRSINTGRVVKQFPRMSSESKGHRAAQLWLFLHRNKAHSEMFNGLSKQETFQSKSVKGF